MSAGLQLRTLLSLNHPLPIAGTINAYCALLAKNAGFKAIYLSGAGVANASRGIPDLGYTTLDDVLTDAKRIIQSTDLPLLIDADTGFGDVSQTLEVLEAAGAAGLHIEDQQDRKRCGHRPGKFLITQDEMVKRVDAAVHARKDTNFVIVARCDALADEGIDSVIARCTAYIAAGADMIFVDAVTSGEEYRRLVQALSKPIIANITEFGQTPLFTQDELKDMGVSVALYPLSAFRAMSQSAEKVYDSIIKLGSQHTVQDMMQTREALYQTLDYYQHEHKQDTKIEG